MSYDIYLRTPRCPTCGRSGDEVGDLPDPTYNLTAIFDLALTGEPLPNPEISEFSTVLLGEKPERPRGLRLLSGRKAKDTIAMIENALARLADPVWTERFVALEPPNKWGTLKDAVFVMQRLLDAAKECGEEYEWLIH